MGDLGSSDPFEPGTVNPEDAIRGTDKSITLCEGDVLLIKPWCEPPEATILDVMLYVKGVKMVTVYFTDISGDVITSAEVCRLSILIYAKVCLSILNLPANLTLAFTPAHAN